MNLVILCIILFLIVFIMLLMNRLKERNIDFDIKHNQQQQKKKKQRDTAYQHKFEQSHAHTYTQTKVTHQPTQSFKLDRDQEDIVKNYLNNNEKIRAIKFIMDNSNLGLAEAKAVVDSIKW
ncbi:hypothetical protein H9L01_03180 [Erysipelothrix inopinata]|uniref:Ribosomal protein L7/L12 C-terminal domain-containing protein n=2 Tax=Erysipelothrix inopinata TaxID=225084 RepID=A0A7G9S0L0_9FIRM|nr:hypothetical protein [Erysipelothrix inopinata]QNN61385.1 hypothetical protein H9L01_03180 [Erysipelothrix inopinata]